MYIIYQLLEILPFDFLKYDFMKNAFLATLFIAPLFALLGTMAVNNKMAFFSDALGHSAFTGMALGVLLGVNNPVICLLAFGVFLSLVICKVKSYNLTSTDTIISVFSSTAMALGIVILSHNGSFAKYSTYLIGDILTIAPNEIWILCLILFVAYIFWYYIYNQLLLLTINTSLASSRGVKTILIENIFVVMVAVTVMISIKWIGILTINSLLILPAAAARNISSNSKQYHIITTIFAYVSSVFGLILSYYLNTSSGATMVLTASVLFFISFMTSRVKN